MLLSMSGIGKSFSGVAVLSAAALEVAPARSWRWSARTAPASPR